MKLEPLSAVDTQLYCWDFRRRLPDRTHITYRELVGGFWGGLGLDTFIGCTTLIASRPGGRQGDGFRTLMFERGPQTLLSRYSSLQ
jgi:hypothetical protein